MSVFRFSDNMFIGKQELDRFMLFMRDNGFIRSLLANSVEFGIVRNAPDRSFDNARVVLGSSGTVDVKPVLAIDSEGRFIYTDEDHNISIPDDDTWYWIKISHEFSESEKGTVDVDADGNLTGTGTEFEKVLRGQPNFATKVKFVGASNNTSEYEVASVVDDQNAVLQGSFQVESDLEYKVVGTFTPGSFPTESEKYPFQYDGCNFELLQEGSLPAFDDGNEFYIARVKNNAGTVTIQDKRTDIYKSRADWKISQMADQVNPLIGVEGVTYGPVNSPLNENVVLISWTFRSSNWTMDTNLSTVTLAGGLGGKFKSTDDFTDGDFDGWRLYTEDGKYSTIKSSSLSGSQINLSLDSLDPSRFSNASQTLVVAPPVEEVELIFTGGSTTNVPNKTARFPSNTEVARVPLEVFGDPTASWNVKYRYRNFLSHGTKRVIPDDTVAGYYNEASYNQNGTLKDPIDRTRVTYSGHATNGFIVLTLNSENLKSRVDELDREIIFGVTRYQLDNNNPEYLLDPDQHTRSQVIDNDITLTVDHFIDLDVDNAQDGNEFYIDINGNVDLNGFQLRITQGYNNPGDIGTVLVDVDAYLVEAAKDGRLWMKFEFDGQGQWIPQVLVGQDPATATVVVSDTEPSNPTEGLIWIDTS